MTDLPHTAFELCTAISTPRLMLRPISVSDSALISAWRSVPENAALFGRAQPTLNQQVEWFDSPRWNRVDYGIVLRETSELIGTVNFSSIDSHRRTAEAGKLIGSQFHRGLGLAKESFAAWLIYGFQVLNLTKIKIRTKSENERNIGLNLSLGFYIEGAEPFGSDPLAGGFIRMTIEPSALTSIDYLNKIENTSFALSRGANMKESF